MVALVDHIPINCQKINYHSSLIDILVINILQDGIVLDNLATFQDQSLQYLLKVDQCFSLPALSNERDRCSYVYVHG